MRRTPMNKGKVKRAFNGRAAKTARINLSSPLRGGIRL